MARQEAHITGSVLTWAIGESGLTREEVAEKLKVEVADIKSWETEVVRPSKGNLTDLAKTLHRPSAVFYLPEPPSEFSLNPAFRHSPGLGQHKLSSSELLEIRKASRLQGILSWIQSDANEPKVTLSHSNESESPEEAAASVREAIGVSLEEQLEWRSDSQALRSWRKSLEELGIIALQLSLGKNGIRGFAIWDDYAPIIAVSSSYHTTARIYTLFHEVGHLILRENAPCREFQSLSERGVNLERWCERFSAAFLMPTIGFKTQSEKYGITESNKAGGIQDVSKLASLFKVSKRAASLRLEKLQLAPPGFYNRISSQLDKYDWPPKSGGGGGGRARPKIRLDEIGERSASIIFRAKDNQRLNDFDVSDYLNLTTDQADDLREIVSSSS